MRFRIGVCACAVMGLLACGSSEEQTIEMEDGGRATLQSDDEGVTVRGTTDDGEEFQARFGKQASLPEDFPEDLPVHPEARVQGSMSMPGKGQMVTFETDESPDEIYRFYTDGLTGQGWTIEAEMNFGGQRMVSASKDDRTASVQVVQGDKGTQVVLTVGRED